MSYLGLNTTTDDHAAKASPADVRRKNRQLIFRLLFPTNQYSVSYTHLTLPTIA